MIIEIGDSVGVVRYEGLPFVARFRWNTGKIMEKFYEKFAEKQIIAARCENCGYTVVPPRMICPKCSSKMDEKNLVNMDGRGVVLSHTVVRKKLDGKGNFIDLNKPEIVAAIKLKGADSQIFVRLGEVEAEELKPGMEVVPVWAEKPEGKPSDLLYFKPG
ncbi:MULTISPECIES: Zn-ribbon domain-containing OB-fold protein [unclassified Archaeoglobus]|uniref:Zn-ribbon domain-containing OB-fold protein n=1 Tax=unclassified Archaeoglobus TaxID=2643606 RepID=UPI0025BD8C48|nr:MULTISPECIES: Zn-ribbon domain-containing OB-fold protein [unclassified Archaeoglobus]